MSGLLRSTFSMTVKIIATLKQSVSIYNKHLQSSMLDGNIAKGWKEWRNINSWWKNPFSWINMHSRVIITKITMIIWSILNDFIQINQSVKLNFPTKLHISNLLISQSTKLLKCWLNSLFQHTLYLTYVTHPASTSQKTCKTFKVGAYTAQKMKFSIKDFFNKYDQIRGKLRIWSHLPNNR